MARWTLVPLLLASAACGGRSHPVGDAAVDSDVALDADGDGGACGDPEVAARLAECRAADDQAGCEGAGGSWGPVGLYPEPICQCPTGQGACPCTRQTDCLSVCLAEPTSGVFGCDGVVEGHCSPVSMTLGCWCFFDEDGAVEGICID